jgi:hypothetical protein
MSQIIENVEAHYEPHEVPFGTTYEWHPEHITLECDCGERLTLSATNTATCRCGTDHSAILRNIQKREDRLPDKVVHTWQHDIQEQAVRMVSKPSAASQNSTRKQAGKVTTHAREVVGFLEQAREMMVEDNAVQPAIEHLHATLREAEGRAAMLESWYRRTYLSGPVGSAPPGR